MRRPLAIALLAAAYLLSQSNTAKEDVLWQYRNRGKAFFENPTTQLQAIAEFKKALELNPNSTRERLNYGLALFRGGKTEEGVAELKKVQQLDPALPHTWFNLGIHYKKQGETEAAVAMFQRMLQLVPDDAVSTYNLGVLYKLQNNLPGALAQFQKASQLNPTLAAPHFQLYNAYRLAGKRDEAARALALFQAMKKAQETSGNSEDMEWNDYAEIYDPIDPSLSDAASTPELKFTSRKLPGTIGDAGSGALTLDLDADSKTDLLVWSHASGGLLYRGATTPYPSPALQSGRYFTAGDFNNDGLPDLCMLTAEGAELLTNRKTSFERKQLAKGQFVKAIWLDYDHDYDLDLLLIGPSPVLLRNQSEAGFENRTADFPFIKATPVDAIAFRLVPDTKSIDVLITYADHASVLYRDRLAAKFEAAELSMVPQNATHLAARDWNHDGTLDLAFLHQSKLQLLANHRASFQPQAGPAISGAAFAFADLANLGSTDILANQALHPIGGAARKIPALIPATVITTADFNGDGRLDVAAAGPEGIVILDNVTASRNRWISVKLDGVKNLKLAPYAEVEVRAGRRYQKQIYGGTPLHFGLRSYEQIDTVRITWPNGLIQNEPRQIPNRFAAYKEAQRLSGSCPMIFTWDGEQFRFLTDVLGVAPLGASSGDGQYFSTDHDEYVWIPAPALVPDKGFYQIRLTEELSEVTYLDQVKLIAVDHPQSTELFSNDKWKSPPYPEFRLFGTQKRIYPVSAHDKHGNNVLTSIEKRDQRYAGPSNRTMSNTAETHILQLAFPSAVPQSGAFLVLHGWVDWADGSTFRRQSQQPGAALTPPSLQMRDAQGRWQTVLEDMGLPSGKTKTVAVDLSNKWISAYRDVRILTNMCVYWDEVFLGIEAATPRYQLREATVQSAELGFHGFSQPRIHPERTQPEQFSYTPTAASLFWNPTSGMYTRFGDVQPLLAQADDMFAIMGSGDEVALRFKALPPPPTGFQRDFLLYVDGWAKDNDPNTAYSQSVEPLPFHRMSQYPYPANEHYPRTPQHRHYIEQYNTRPALKLLRPIAP